MSEETCSQPNKEETLATLKRWAATLSAAIKDGDFDDINRITYVIADTLVRQGFNVRFNYIRVDNELKIKRKGRMGIEISTI